MTRSPLAAALAATALLAGLTSCSDDQSSTSTADPAPSSSRTGADPSPTGETDDRDPGFSEPVEDSVYPDVGDPSVDALTYGLELAWDPDGRVLTGSRDLAVPIHRHGRPRAARPRRAARGVDPGGRRQGGRLRAHRQGPRHRRRLRGGPAVRAVSGLLRLARARGGAHDAPGLQHDGLHDLRRRVGVDDAGALRRLLLVRRQRPAVRQGLLRLRPLCTRPDDRRRQRRDDQPQGGGRQHGHRVDARQQDVVVPRHRRLRRLQGHRGRVLERRPDQLLGPDVVAAVPRRAALHLRGPRLGRGQARPLPLVVARRPPRRLVERDGDPDDDHAGSDSLRHQQGRCSSTRSSTSGTATRSRRPTGATSG